MSRRPSSSSSVKARAAALSAPSSARRSAPTRPTKTSRPCNPRWSRHSASATSKKSPDQPPNEKEVVMPSPTIVLVHGAFGDASSWRPVYDRLVDDGHAVLAPPNPLRGIPYDASFTASVIDQIEGPVVLVGHSYGGAGIPGAGSSDKVAGVVYVAGVAPDEGESVNDLQGRFPSLAMGPLVRPAQLADGSVEVSIDPARFHDVFCADVPGAGAAFMAISQRTVSATAFDDPSTAAAWRTKPSWAAFGTADYPLPPELPRFPSPPPAP